MNKFKASQTALKDFENKDTCLKRWKHQWINKEFSLEPNIYMQRGKYFEELCLGEGAIEGEKTELPLIKTGKKTIDQIRIEEQAEKFKQLFDKDSELFLGFSIRYIQIKLEDDESTGVADFDAIDKEGNDCLFDLKLTRDLDSESEFSWKDPKNLDLIQQIHYADLYEKRFRKKPKNYLIIFDYSPEMKVKLVELDILKQSFDQKDGRFLDFWEEKRMLDSLEDYPTVPSKEECKKCPLKCADRIKEELVCFEKIIY